VVFRKGGRAGDVFYRDRWSHDKVVRSTHTSRGRMTTGR
jgi:nitrate reductase alpha subunit